MAQQMMVYLDKAVLAVKSLGIGMDSKEDSPIVALLQKTSLIDADAALGLAKVLREASMFNDMVRTQIAGMEISNRYEIITDSFNSIKEDCQTLVLQASDGKMDFKEKIQHHWMNVRRGSVPSRFEKVRDVYMEVSNDLNKQIVREQTILSAYKDYRVAMKEGQIIALGMLKSATTKLDTLKVNVSNANDDIAKSVGDDILKAQLELTRDHKVREYQEFDRIYQIVKDVSDNLTVGYSASEVVMARLMQTSDLKERVYSQAVVFFSTNETTLTAINATVNSMMGLNEGTKNLNAMKDGINQSIEMLSTLGDTAQLEAVKAGYGPTLKVESIQKLVDSIVDFQGKSVTLIAEMRKLATENAQKIEEVVQEGQAKYAQLINTQI